MDSFTIINDALQPKYTVSFEAVTTEMHADKEIRAAAHNFLLITPGQKIWRTLNLAHPRAQNPTIQELLVDTERLDPDFHGVLLGL